VAATKFEPWEKVQEAAEDRICQWSENTKADYGPRKTLCGRIDPVGLNGWVIVAKGRFSREMVTCKACLRLPDAHP
jgi:hypothetical protein